MCHTWYSIFHHRLQLTIVQVVEEDPTEMSEATEATDATDISEASEDNNNKKVWASVQLLFLSLLTSPYR